MGKLTGSRAKDMAHVRVAAPVVVSVTRGKGGKMSENKCPKCNEPTLRHMHDTAHGIAGTHMAGTERFECECGFVCWGDSAEAKKLGLKFVLDRTSKEDDELEELFK